MSFVLCTQYVVWAGWTLNSAAGFAAVFGLFNYCKTGEITPAAYIMYALFGRITWALCLAWIVFACATGNGGICAS